MADRLLTINLFLHSIHLLLLVVLGHQLEPSSRFLIYILYPWNIGLSDEELSPIPHSHFLLLLLYISKLNNIVGACIASLATHILLPTTTPSFRPSSLFSTPFDHLFGLTGLFQHGNYSDASPNQVDRKSCIRTFDTLLQRSYVRSFRK